MSEELATIPLVLTEEDLPRGIRNSVVAAENDDRLLGNAASSLYDALPAAITNKLRKITPDGFVVSEVELKLSLGGTLFGVGISGDVVVKLTPEQRSYTAPRKL